MYRQHGDLDSVPFVEGVTPILGGPDNMLDLDGAPIGPTNRKPNRGFRFGSLFPNLMKPQVESLQSASSALLSESALLELGQAMIDGPDTGDHPSLPAGYTFLGQFIAHDISFDETEGIPALSVDRIRQGRSPSLDLDSLYGMDPPSQSQFYEADGLHLKLGKTEGTRLGDANREFLNDLPRDHPDDPRFAFIPDTRNDDSLGVAQTHVAFIKFHNAVVDSLSGKGMSREALFTEAKETVVKHYQWIILRDFLPKIVQEPVLNDVRENPDKYFANFFGGGQGKEPPMPVEFSYAAFRLGHSMLRALYNWNRVFQEKDGDTKHQAILFDLFSLTGFNGRMQRIGKRLPSNWIIDWTRFFDFSGFEGVSGSEDVRNNPKSNKARKIDTSLTFALKNLPGFLAKMPQRLRLLSTLDLIRAKKVGLPTGQNLARAVNALDIPMRFLNDDEVARGPHESILRKHKLDKQTPLWYYILKEAQELNGGELLGPLGSIIVAATLVGLIRASRVSILDGSGWEPHLGQIKTNEFFMTDLLVFVKKNNREVNELNPIG